MSKGLGVLHKCSCPLRFQPGAGAVLESILTLELPEQVFQRERHAGEEAHGASNREDVRLVRHLAACRTVSRTAQIFRRAC